MKTFRAFLSALFLFAALPAFAASTKSDYQKDFDFGQLRTFAFKTERDSKDRLATNTLEAARIQNALAAQLEAKGFTPSNDNPDFIVAFYSRTQQKTQVNSTGFGFGPGWGWGYGVPFAVAGAGDLDRTSGPAHTCKAASWPTSLTPRPRNSFGAVWYRTRFTELDSLRKKRITPRRIW
jgi:hypothetical protein